MVIHLLPKVGFGWTMRICAFFILGLLIIRSLTVSSDLQHDPNPVKMNHYFHQGINLKRLTEPPVHKTCGIWCYPAPLCASKGRKSFNKKNPAIYHSYIMFITPLPTPSQFIKPRNFIRCPIFGRCHRCDGLGCCLRCGRVGGFAFANLREFNSRFLPRLRMSGRRVRPSFY